MYANLYFKEMRSKPKVFVLFGFFKSKTVFLEGSCPHIALSVLHPFLRVFKERMGGCAQQSASLDVTSCNVLRHGDSWRSVDFPKSHPGIAEIPLRNPVPLALRFLCLRKCVFQVLREDTLRRSGIQLRAHEGGVLPPVPQRSVS